MAAGTTTTYEVTVTFLMDQPDDLLLSEPEIEDNVQAWFDDVIGTHGEIGFAAITPATVSASIEIWEDEI